MVASWVMLKLIPEQQQNLAVGMSSVFQRDILVQATS
jgi:hypothetical protein